MNGIQFFLLAFSLTLVEVINALLVGCAGMVVFCEYFSIFRTYIFYNLSLVYLFRGFHFAMVSMFSDSLIIGIASKRKTGACTSSSWELLLFIEALSLVFLVCAIPTKAYCTAMYIDHRIMTIIK